MGKISINTKMKQHGIRLNKEQCDAVKQLNDVSVVTAGGGCGKTNLLIAKINPSNVINGIYQYNYTFFLHTFNITLQFFISTS